MTPAWKHVARMAVLALTMSACHSSISGGPVRPDPLVQPYPATTLPDLAPPNRSTQPTSGSRQFCRGDQLPSGWIAVDYVEAPRVCSPQSSESEQYTGTVAVQYDLLVDYSELLACSDQRVPRGWSRRALTDTTVAGTRCPTSRRDVPAAKRVMLIQRLP